MKRINVLNEHTANKIAAGEVVERPSSVVKELVENSIDAGAKNITVEIYDGGQRSIKVIDDGTGIHPEDVEKAFMTHATSKIFNIEDIYKISTLGFRGEALPSIASVSDTILTSRQNEYDFGKEIYISGGNVEYFKDIGCSKGTTVQVNNLFFNVPARQKFLKTSQREGALISDIIMRLALANPGISFKFYKDGKKGFTTYSTDKLDETIRSLYGKEVYNNIFPFENHSDICSVHGYIGNSEISRGSRNRQSIFVNNRFIQNRMLTTAVENAFKSFLTVNKFPFFVLFLDIYPEFIDVNVHPTKSEIKFQEERAMFKLVFDAVHKALRESLKDSFNISFEDEISSEGENLNKEKSSNDRFYEKKSLVQNENFNNILEQSNKYSSDLIKHMEQIPIDLKSPNSNIKLENSYENILNNQTERIITSNYKEDFHKEDLEYSDSDMEEEKTPKFAKLNIIGQFNTTYILGEVNNELYMIDQHAAHEKILFEKYKSEMQKGDVVSQILLTPEVQELSPEDFICYNENNLIFREAGFNIELFGENTISIREVPIILGKPDIKNLFMDILEDLKKMGSGKTSDVKYNSIARKACRAAVKARDKLSKEEMEYLIEELRYIEEPFTCPHGRPTIIRFTLNDIEKRFKRIQ